MSNKLLQINFLRAVNSLNLRFPVAEISEKTGVGQPTVSVYLSGKREVSAKFVKLFCDAFGLNFDDLLKNADEEPEKKEEPSAMQILAGLTEGFKAIAETMRSIESKMAQESTQGEIIKKVQALNTRTEKIESSLGEMEDKSSVAANLNFVVATVKKLSQIQDQAIEDLRDDISRIRPAQNTSEKDERKNNDQNDGDGHKLGKRRAKRN